MDTKWKKFSYAWLLKTIAFILVIICLTAMMGSLLINEVGINGQTIELDTAGEQNYYASDRYQLLVSDVVHIAGQLTNDYKSESYLTNRGRLDHYMDSHEMQQLYRQFKNESELYSDNIAAEENYNRFQQEYAQRIEAYINQSIASDIETYKNLVRRLEDYPLDYYIDTGEQVITNTSVLSASIKDNFKDKKSYFIIDHQSVDITPPSVLSNEEFGWLEHNIEQLSSPNTQVYFGFKDDFIEQSTQQWRYEKQQASWILKYLLIISIIGFMCFIYLIIVVGKKYDQNNYVLNFTDKIYTDIKLLLMMGLTLGLVPIFSMANEQNLFEWFWGSFIIIAVIDLSLFLSLVKHLKRRNFIGYSLTAMIIKKIIQGIKKSIIFVLNKRAMGFKVIFLIIFYTATIMFLNLAFRFNAGIAIIGSFIIMLVLTLYSLQKVGQFNRIKNGVQKIRNGHLSHEINISGSGELSILGDNINQISDGFSEAIENEMKNERLKTELITNVSHDIRTPLTSIITYVDLLKKEEDQQKIQRYIEVLEQKSERLNRLIDDLFDASKINSGQIEAKKETVNILELVHQAQGEMENQIKTAKLDFKINSVKKPLIIGDGQLLWRVIENLFSNVIKYSLKGSRVYIDIKEQQECMALEIKNISKEPLNIAPEELFERFIRGDESRTTEGNGLGLSIAKSLIELQKGTLSIVIDGDLFKVIVTLPKKNEQL